jgi:hypothetical protein
LLYLVYKEATRGSQGEFGREAKNGREANGPWQVNELYEPPKRSTFGLFGCWGKGGKLTEAKKLKSMESERRLNRGANG